MTNCSCVQTFLSSSVQHWCLVSLLYSEKFTPVHSPEVSPFTKWDHPMEQIKCFSVSWWPKMSIFLRNYSEFNSIFFIFLYLYLWPTQWGYILFFFLFVFLLSLEVHLHIWLIGACCFLTNLNSYWVLQFFAEWIKLFTEIFFFFK